MRQGGSLEELNKALSALADCCERALVVDGRAVTQEAKTQAASFTLEMFTAPNNGDAQLCQPSYNHDGMGGIQMNWMFFVSADTYTEARVHITRLGYVNNNVHLYLQSSMIEFLFNVSTLCMSMYDEQAKQDAEDAVSI